MASAGSVWMPQAMLDGLKHYKYASVDKSLLSIYVFQPYWNWAITLFPLWIAPNLITLIGFSFILINLATMLIYTPDLETPAPSWVYLSFAIGLHLYQTFDNVDGRQARRTKSSSPLGELFDHGCDALNASVGGLLQAAGTGLGCHWRTMLLLLSTIGAFYVSTWEEYHTHVLQFGVINGPVEGIFAGCVVMALSGIFGVQIWRYPVVQVMQAAGLPTPQWIPADLLTMDALLGVLLLSVALVQVPTSLLAVYQVRTKSGKSFLATLSGLVPFVVYAASCYFWMAAPGSTIIPNHLVLFALSAGVCFGRMATKIITAYVTSSAFPYFTVQLLPLVLGAINANMEQWFGMPPLISMQHEGAMIWAMFAFAVLQYAFWANIIIDSFCRHLKIRAFVIPYLKQA